MEIGIMKEFEQAVAAAVSNMVASGKLTEIIEGKVAKTVDDIVGDALRQYSDFGKGLKDAVVKAVAFDAEELGLAGYNQIVLEIVRRKINGSIFEAGAKQIEADMEKLLAADSAAEITITKLYQDLAEFARDCNGCEKHQRPTMHIGENSYGYRHVYMDGKPNQEKYGCAFSMMVGGNGKVTNLRLCGRDAGKTLFVGSLNAFEETLFRLYVAKATIIVDIEDVDDIELGDDGEDF
jgi:hypothetical protein